VHIAMAGIFNIWLQKREVQPGVLDLALIVDESERSEAEIARLLSPWKWVNVEVCVKPSRLSLVSEWLTKGHGPGRAIACFSSEPRVRQMASDLAGSECKLIHADLPKFPSWENDAYRELCHHDYELGGVNEWDGAPTNHAVHMLHRLSRWHSRVEFPFWAFPDGPRFGLRAIDVGCGPITLLRWGALNWGMEVTGVDPLIDLYEILAARHGFDTAHDALPKHRLSITGEDMIMHIPERSYDFIYTNNALDHTLRPAIVMDNILKIVAPAGRAAISLATREGTRQGWDQFHQTDIWSAPDESIWFKHREGPSRLLFDASQYSVRILHSDDRWLSFIVNKP
jgi:SAM-dependent methyltransferase